MKIYRLLHLQACKCFWNDPLISDQPLSLWRQYLVMLEYITRRFKLWCKWCEKCGKIFSNTETKTKWPPFCRQLVHIYSAERKGLYFDSNSTDVCFKGFSWQNRLALVQVMAWHRKAAFQSIASLWPSEGMWCHWNGLSLVQVMACCWLGAKLLLKLMPTYC